MPASFETIRPSHIGCLVLWRSTYERAVSIGTSKLPICHPGFGFRRNYGVMGQCGFVVSALVPSCIKCGISLQKTMCDAQITR